MRKLFILFMLAVMAGCAQQPVVTSNGIPNFHEVGNGIYRGGQPVSAEGWAYLKSLGVKTIVKLDLASEGSDDEAQKLGMEVVDASGPPSDISNFLEAPKPDRIRLAVETLEDKGRRPVYVHCLHGQDRTGLIVGLYRVRNDGYTKEAAMKEMLDNGFHQAFHGLTEIWEKFDGKKIEGGMSGGGKEIEGGMSGGGKKIEGGISGGG